MGESDCVAGGVKDCSGREGDPAGGSLCTHGRELVVVGSVNKRAWISLRWVCERNYGQWRVIDYALASFVSNLVVVKPILPALLFWWCGRWGTHVLA